MNQKRVALYLRLSKEDIDKPTKFSISESIKNQELLLREEVKKHPDWVVVAVYSDEDFSGAGTYRPSFDKMIHACEKHMIDIILCKSQSRFSRDMELIEKYIHNKFKEWNIRFISIVDNADTDNDGNKKSRQINALVNEWFLEDLSDNIRATLRTKWQHGECTAAFAKYGFLKDPQHKNHLIIDTVASQTIQEIAHLFLEGKGPETIAHILEQKHIPSPYEYKLQMGSKLKIPLLSLNHPKIITKNGKYIFTLFPSGEPIDHVVLSILPFQDYDMTLTLIKQSGNVKVYYSQEKFSSAIETVLPVEHSSFWRQLPINLSISHIQLLAIYCLPNNLEKTYLEWEINIHTLPSHDFSLNIQSFDAIHQPIDFWQYRIRKKYQWNSRTIYHILKDETYHGTLIQGKTKRISYKNHTSIATPKEQWYVQENILPKILDDQTWIAIQNKLQLHPRASKNGKHPIFTGKVFCGVCGKPLQKNSSSSLASPVKKEYLICKARKEHWKNCENKKSFPVLELQKLIITQFQNLWNSYYDMTTLKQIHKEEPHHQTIDDLMKEEQNLQEIIQQNNQILYQLYKDKSTGLMDDSCFHTLLLQNQQEMDTYHQRLQMIAQELKQIQTKQEFFMSTVCEFLNTHSFEDYFSTILQHFISSIFIGKLNHHQRTIQIHWKI